MAAKFRAGGGHDGVECGAVGRAAGEPADNGGDVVGRNGSRSSVDSLHTRLWQCSTQHLRDPVAQSSDLGARRCRQRRLMRRNRPRATLPSIIRSLRWPHPVAFPFGKGRSGRWPAPSRLPWAADASRPERRVAACARARSRLPREALGCAWARSAALRVENLMGCARCHAPLDNAPDLRHSAAGPSPQSASALS